MEVDDADGRRARGGFGRALADLFRELGYDEGDLHADMFEWLFGLPSLRVQAFLDWFLASMRARQSVKRQLGGAREYAIYKTLLARRGGLLTGEQLARAEMACESERAMQRHGGAADSDESLDAVERANAALECEVAAMETKLRLANERHERLARLAQRCGAVADQQTQRLRRLQDREQFSEILAQIAPGKKRSPAGKAPTPDELVGRIRATLRHLATPAPSVSGDALIPSAQHRSSSAPNLVARTPTKSLTRENPASSALSVRDEARKWRDFLYQHSMEPLQTQEEANLRSLQAKIPAISALRSTPSVQSSGDTSHEPNGSSDVAMSPAPTATRRGNDVPSPWLHESDPTQLNMRDQDTLLYNKCCVELDRLRKAFVVGEQDALLAQLQVTRYESQLRQLTSSRRQLLQQFQLMSRDAIWARKQILQASVDKTKKQLGELFQRALPEKLDELAFLKSTNILLHSYEQKLWRQENRFVKLRLLLEGFEMQHARLRLVHCLLDAERQDLLQIDNIFQQLVATVRDHNHSTEKRIHSYDTTSGSDAARNTLAQTYLHEQDDVAHLLFEALERKVHEGEQQQAMTHAVHLRTFDDLVRLGEEKCSKQQNLEETSARLYHEFKRLYDSKRFTLDQLRRELFGDATSSTPMLMPVELETTLRQATETKDAAEIGLEKALETLRLHRRSVQVDPSKRMQQERDIARLRRELQERL